jgi:hypothetical protein
MKINPNNHQTMKKILVIALLSAGISIAITNSPVCAAPFGSEQYQNQQNQQQRDREHLRDNDGSNKPNAPIPASDYDPSYTQSFGAIMSKIVGGIGVISNQGVTMYGFRANFPIGEKIKLRAGAYSNLAGSSDPESSTANASLTYNFSDPGTTFNPFLGVGYGSNTIGKGGSNNSPGTSASSFYYTGGVDLNFGGIHLTTAIILPNNSVYGTEFQAAFNVAGGF